MFKIRYINAQPFVDIGQIAEVMGVHPETVRRGIRDGGSYHPHSYLKHHNRYYFTLEFAMKIQAHKGPDVKFADTTKTTATSGKAFDDVELMGELWDEL